MRRVALFCCASSLCLGIVHCVGDEPSNDTGGGTDASSDGLARDGGGDGDGSTQNDGSSTDAGDSGPTDSCIGHADCPNDVEAANLQLWLRGDIGATCI